MFRERPHQSAHEGKCSKSFISLPVSPTPSDMSRPKSQFELRGGYDEDRFVVDVASHFKCPICLDVLRDPVQCKQEHAFCASCIHHFLATQGESCPECKDPLTPQDLLPWSRILRNLLGDLKLKCKNEGEGCSEVTTLAGAEDHYKNCKFGSHPCRYCRTEVEFKKMEAHEASCDHKSEVCQNECGLRIYPNRLPKHNCITALKARISSMSELLAQQRADFDQRIGPFEEYVKQHENGNMVPWERVFREYLSSQSKLNVSMDESVKATPRITHAVHSIKKEVQSLTFSIDPDTKGAHVELRNNNRTMTSANEDCGGCAAGDVLLSQGIHYWEARIDAMWDSACSDGSIRMGVAVGSKPDFTKHEVGIGDDQNTIGWWDNTIDGAIYAELQGERDMREGDHIGILLDLNRSVIEFYIEKLYMGETEIPQTSFYPVFYTRTHFDRITLIDNPTIPDFD